MRVHRRGLVIGLMYSVAASAFAADKSNFSGKWKLNLAKSDLGPVPRPAVMTQVIGHKDPDLRVKTTVVGGPQGNLEYEAKYTTDGKESSNQFGAQKARSVVTWEGQDLVIDTKANFGGEEVTIKGRWSLLDGGKTLKQVAHIQSAQGQFDSTYVFDKE